jgi:2-dehydro-3-deoxyphosphogluconate aldolase/(4S)-4-hydroxy-2-oxoglutarate aldolase
MCICAQSISPLHRPSLAPLDDRGKGSLDFETDGVPAQRQHGQNAMNREQTLKRILEGGIVAVVRSETSEPLVKVVEALALGGVTAAEITFTVPDAIEVIRQVRRAVGNSLVLGAGTVLDSETARAAILAGAEYIVSPIVNVDVIRLCRRYDKVVMPGALTPTEVVSAWESGADVVKIFPADLGGPPYLKALRGPLPQIRLMPTGGVDLSTAGSFINAGACCLGVGSSLVDPKSVASGDFAAIRELAAQFVAIVRQARGTA